MGMGAEPMELLHGVCGRDKASRKDHVAPRNAAARIPGHGGPNAERGGLFSNGSRLQLA